jgi:MFS family permease
MAEFALGAAALGNLSAFYFYSYVAMQIPTGIIADRWGPRKLLTAGAAVAALGTALFAAAPDLWWANAGRLLIGASVAVAFVCLLKLAGHWFAPRHFPLVSGMALFVGIVGAVFAGRPLRAMVEVWGWREVMAVSAALTAVLAVVIWLRVRDDPADSGYASHFDFAGEHSGGARTSVWRDLAEVLSYRNVWLLFFTPGGIAGAVLTFAGLWGVPYFTQVYGMSPKEAALLTSTLLVAWALAGPLLGSVSQKLGRRKPVYVAGCALALAGWSVFVLLPALPMALLLPLLLLLGFASGGFIVGFAFAKESVPARLTGTASGLINTGVMMGAMILQPAEGWMLDRHWLGSLAGAVRIYEFAAWQAGFALMLGWVALSLILISLSRESYCKPMA